jgi:hypothetical protein
MKLIQWLLSLLPRRRADFVSEAWLKHHVEQDDGRNAFVGVSWAWPVDKLEGAK